MIKSLLRTMVGILLIGFLGFQNCSQFEPLLPGIVYPYDAKPIYFSDLKFIGEQRQVDRSIYTFDFVVSLAADPRTTVDYRVSFFAADDSPICPAQTGIVTNANNHVRIECPSAVLQKSIRAEVSAQGNGNPAATRSFYF